MSVSGAITLVDLSIPADSSDLESAPVNFDNFAFTVDLGVASSYTLTGNFETLTGPEASYSSFVASGPGLAPLPGTFTLNPTDGTFTYTVTRAELITGGGDGITSQIEVFGLDASANGEFDSLIFNFVLCFGPETAIATPGGARMVEALQPGDAVLTADGVQVPVKWIGRITVDPMFNPAHRLAPIRIRAGALGPDTPNRDLTVTADHGMVLDGLVVNAGALVNGDTIEALPWKAFAEQITFYHVETEKHEVIVANGAPAESFIDYVGRQSFDNHADYLALYGADSDIAEMSHPRITSARMVPAGLRQRLLDRALHSASVLAKAI